MSDDIGLEIPFGIDPSGRLLHVSVVARGLACNCTCPKCSGPLIARHGDVLRWHFAHHNANANCQGARETAIHRAAKDAIASAATVKLPALWAQHRTLPYRIARPECLVPLTNVRLEAWQDGFRPDILATADGSDLAIEILVTHPVGDAKRALLAGRNIATIEIDLSLYARQEIRADFATIVVERAHRTWLHNPEQRTIDAELAAELTHAAAIAAAKQAAIRAAEQAERERHARIEAALRLQREVELAEWRARWKQAERQREIENERRKAQTQAERQAEAREAERQRLKAAGRLCFVCGSDRAFFGYAPPSWPSQIWACLDHRQQAEARHNRSYLPR